MGIDFNSLPKNLQTKLEPYMTVGGAKSVEEAIAKAKDAKVWSADDEKTLASINGGANFGRLDGFDSSKAKTYKYEAALKRPLKNMAKSDNSAAAALGTGVVVGGVIGAFVGGPVGAATGAAVGGGLMALVGCQTKDEDNFTWNSNGEAVINVTYKNDYSALEKAIRDGNAITHQFLQKILDHLADAIKNQEIQKAELGAYFELILQALGTNNELLATLVNFAGDNTALLKAMLDKLTESQSELNELKNRVIANHEDDIAYQKQALELLANIKSTVYGLGDLGKYYQNIVNNMINQGESLESIKAYVKQITENTEVLKDFAALDLELGNQILKAIKNINIGDVDLSALLTAVNQNGQHIKDLSKLLENINNNVEKGNADAKVRGQKIIAAIEKLGVNVSYDLNAILNKIPNDKDYSTVLNAILAKIGDIDAANRANFKKVLDALAKIAANQKDVDLQPIMDKLQEILQAIKDHKVTVDVTGKVTCECNCGDGGKHEGIIGNLNDLLG